MCFVNLWQALYRNRARDVERFLDRRHGPGNYLVINLCEEARYYFLLGCCLSLVCPPARVRTRKCVGRVLGR